MPLETSYSNARAHLASLCDRVAEEHDTVIIRRRGHPDVALIDAAELRSLLETAHLLRSPRNARRLLEAIERARAADLAPGSPRELRESLGLAPRR